MGSSSLVELFNFLYLLSIHFLVHFNHSFCVYANSNLWTICFHYLFFSWFCPIILSFDIYILIIDWMRDSVYTRHRASRCYLPQESGPPVLCCAGEGMKWLTWSKSSHEMSQNGFEFSIRFNIPLVCPDPKCRHPRRSTERLGSGFLHFQGFVMSLASCFMQL